ncbi:hypothetical protein EGW08_011922 [Elysia chlorotica]|uniref:Uncharacterized protein n=1 Tax=Elysia chlorotica TaxID=188477 RepID=A0A3S0ZL70_ELYCH|nr:hypothetical protein EGW08_011922 [Elysia chlorotica]
MKGLFIMVLALALFAIAYAGGACLTNGDCAGLPTFKHAGITSCCPGEGTLTGPAVTCSVKAPIRRIIMKGLFIMVLALTLFAIAYAGGACLTNGDCAGLPTFKHACITSCCPGEGFYMIKDGNCICL